MPESRPLPAANGAFDAVLFDLLTGLLDSWSLWDAVAGDAAAGRRWRGEYLRLTYATGRYRPYEDLVAEAAGAQDLDAGLATDLVRRWDELEAWPEAPHVVAEIAATRKVGVVTNCSNALGARAAAKLCVGWDALVIAERVGAYKPRPEAYRAALDELGLPAERVLFVAGSRYDVAGAGALGMDVWWHNRVGLPREDAPAPLAEESSLAGLPAFLSGWSGPANGAGRRSGGPAQNIG